MLACLLAGWLAGWLIQLHHPGRVELADTNQQLFEKYKDYLLGDYCYGLRSNEASGFADALALAWRHFTTPLSLRLARAAARGEADKNKKQKTARRERAIVGLPTASPSATATMPRTAARKAISATSRMFAPKCLGEHPVAKCTQAKPDQPAQAS